jgi:hypothetical protein
MNYLRIYKELDVTNQEVIEALIQLGFSEVSGSPKEYKMMNELQKSVIRIPREPLDSFILKAYTASYSNLLYLQGIIPEFDDFVKMIEKNRLEKMKKEGKPA